MKALLIDGLNIVRRIHAAIVGRTRHSDSEQDRPHPDPQQVQGIVQSILGSFQKALNQHQPSHVLVVFESSGRNWRHRLYPAYKKNRPPIPAEIETIVSTLGERLPEIGLSEFALLGYEADDIIATISHKLAHHQGRVVILSSDRNYCQLLNDHIQIYDHFGSRYLTIELAQQHFGVPPEDIPDLMALAGDSSLNIPGIHSIGKRTAARLIHEYGSLEQILDAAEHIPGKLGSKLYSGKEDALLAQTLFTLKRDIELGINLNELRYPRIGQREPERKDQLNASNTSHNPNNMDSPG